MSREKIRLGDLEDQEEPQGRCDMTVNMGYAVAAYDAEPHPAVRLTPTSVPTTLGDSGHRAQRIGPPPWPIPLAVLLAEGFTASRPDIDTLPSTSYLLGPYSAIMLPLPACLALLFAVLQVQGLMSTAVRKGKY